MVFGLGLLLVSSVDKWEGCMRKCLAEKPAPNQTFDWLRHMNTLNRLIRLSKLPEPVKNNTKVKKPVDHVGI